MPKLVRNVLIITAVLIIATLGVSGTAYAQPPAMPQQFYGSVTVNNLQAEPGNVISIKIAGQEVASVNTDSRGRYGYDPIIAVNGANGAQVEFYINGVKAQQVATFSSGAITKVDISVGAQMPPPSPPPVEPAPSMPEEEEEGEDNNNNNNNQSSQTPTGGGITINTNIMGQPGSFSINSANVLAQSAEFASSDGNFKISMAANTTVNIQGQSLSASVESSPPVAPDTAKLISAYKIEPSGTTFDPAITINVKYNQANLPEGITGPKLYIAYWNNTEWVTLSSQVDIENSLVKANTAHFTIFGLFGSTAVKPQPSQSVFAVTGLSIEPLTALPGEEVKISARVSNNGDAEGSYQAILNVNSINEASKSVTVNPGKTETITFAVTKKDAGQYEVSIGSQKGSFTIATPTTDKGFEFPATMFGLPTYVIGILALAILLIIILIVVSVRKRRA